MTDIYQPVVVENAGKLANEVDELDAKLDDMSTRAMEIVVETPYDQGEAFRALQDIAGVVEVLKNVTERFRKPAYDYYKSVQKEQKRLLEKPEAAIQHLRNQLQSYRERVELALQAAKEEYVADGTEEADEKLHRATSRAEAETPGLTYRTYWRARLNEKDPRSLQKLCLAIGEGRAPVGLVTFNTSEANALARALMGEMRYDGVETYSERRPVRS